MLRRTAVGLSVVATAAALTSAPALAAKPAAAGHETVTHGMVVRDAHASKGAARPTKSSLLTYHGGVVQKTPQVVIVYWGSQWDPAGTGRITNDPAGEAPLQLSFFNNIGSDTWVDSTRQYCGGVPTGTTTCSTASYATWNIPNLVFGTWVDSASAAPSRPSQSDLAAEAVKAAQHFGNNLNVQYIIDTASGNNASGFGTQYCAWHSSTSYSAGTIAYTNMPYVADAAGSCGAGYVSTTGTTVASATEGVTIVGGHEWAETITDEYPNGGWLDGSGAENGDKCAWVSSGTGATRIITTASGNQYAVQTLWSNSANGCVAGSGH